jgi:hypothetical protein
MSPGNRLQQRRGAGDVLDEFRRDIVALLQVFRGIIREPDFAAGVLPNEGL